METVAVTRIAGVDDRLLWGCLFGSMALHAALIAFSPQAKPREEPPPPKLTATLRAATPQVAAPPPTPQPVVEPVKAPEPPKPQETPPAPRPEARPPEPKAARPAVEPKAADARPPAPAPAPSTPAPAVAALAPSAAPAPAAPAVPAPPAAAPAPAAEARAAAPSTAAPDVSERELVAQYELQLASIVETRKLKRYPSEAMQNGWEGTSTVLLRIGTDGKIAGVETARSAGHDLLDEQARTSISRAKPFVPIPEALKGKAFEARVRVVFSLKN
jgi:TonB family protein